MSEPTDSELLTFLLSKAKVGTQRPLEPTEWIITLGGKGTNLRAALVDAWKAEQPKGE